MYGSETWTLASDTKRRLESCEMWFLSRGRRRILWMDSLQKLLEERGVKELGVVLIQKARNRGLWNSMIAKVNRYGTDTPFTVASNTATAAGVFSVKARTRYKLSRDNTASR